MKQWPSWPSDTLWRVSVFQYGFNGSVVEWSMALVLKTRDCNRSVSSNLTASANIDRCESWSNRPPWKGVRSKGHKGSNPFLSAMESWVSG